MIVVTYKRSEYSVSIRGHAGSNEPGRDLVCAAVSILTYTLSGAIDRMLTDNLASSGVIQIDPGDTDISCNPNDNYKDKASIIMDSICRGFVLLSDNYPQYIQTIIDD